MIAIIERAKFFDCGGRRKRVVGHDDRGRAVVDVEDLNIINPAVIEIDGIRLMSETPKSAAQTAKINAAIERMTAAKS